MSKSGISCRLATETDQAVVARLFHLCDVHYWGDKAPPLETVADYVGTQVLGPERKIEILLAEADDETLGFASFALLYPGPDLGAQVYMKDLFVPEQGRSRGIGEALLRAGKDRRRARLQAARLDHRRPQPPRHDLLRPPRRAARDGEGLLPLRRRQPQGLRPRRVNRPRLQSAPAGRRFQR